MSLDEIKNFAVIHDQLATSGQPTEAQLAEVAAAGFEVVVNLGLLDQPYSLRDEAGFVASLGLGYHHLPVDFTAPVPADVRKFIVVMDASAGKRMFVHCAANYRVSSFVALYGELRLHWTRRVSDACAQRFWQLDDVWRSLLAAGRADLDLL